MLLSVLPDASASWLEHLEDAGGEDLSYIGVGVFAQNIVELYGSHEIDSFPAVFSTIEKLLIEGNDEVKGLITVGLLESLQNISSWTNHGYGVFEQWLEPNTIAAWHELQATWEGKSSLAEVLRQELKQEK